MNAKRSPYTRHLPQAEALVILFSVAMVLTFSYFMWVMSSPVLLEERFQVHAGIINNAVISPYPYRVLVPFMMEPIIWVMSGIIGERAGFIASYLIYDFVVLYLILITLYHYLLQWFNRNQSMVGTLFVAATMFIALRDHGYQPWSFLEVSLFTYALMLTERRQYRRLAVLVLVASLNRETAVFIPMAFAFMSIDFKGILKRDKPIFGKSVRWATAYFLIWLVIFVGLRAVRGVVGTPVTLASRLEENLILYNLAKTLINIILFQGFFWVFAMRGFRYTPEPVKKAAMVLPIYVITLMVHSKWMEVRLLMILYPIIVPMALGYIYHTRATIQPTALPEEKNG